MPPKRKAQPKLISVPELSPDVARQLIQDQKDGIELEDSKVLWLSGLDVPVCKGQCKTNDKSNPNCFCLMVPAEGSFKKKGLWKKEPDALSKLGPDPNDTFREDPSKPCGLSNLGNTCYVNSALQCMFMVPSFRWGLYRVPSPVAEEVILTQLRNLFLALDFGPNTVVNPTQFAACLDLDHSVQQDGQEFFKLLLTKVQDLMAKCNDQALNSLIARLFRGTFSYITVCRECGQPSSSSSTATDFYELPLQVMGFSNLQDSMVSALTAEILDGTNQYACDFCSRKTDASRQQVLRQLPPYLCLQLARFVFDYRTEDKKKVTDKFSFPLTLDMPQLLASVAPDHDHGVATEDAAGGPAGTYELMAVLIHKGGSASHGHYVAHIKAPDGQWWRFDDETVTLMGAQPTSNPGDHGTTAAAAGSSKGDGKASKAGGKTNGKAKAAGAKKGKPKRKRPSSSCSEEEEAAEAEGSDVEMEVLPVPAEQPAAAGEQPAPEVTSITSSNAYMLLYRQVGWSEEPDTGAGQDQLPAASKLYVQEMREEFETQRTHCAEVKKEAVQKVEERRKEVRELLACAPVRRSMGPSSKLVPSTWLEAWCLEEDAPAWDVSTLLCQHSHVDPAKAASSKRVSEEAWTILSEKQVLEPVLEAPKDVCRQCLLAQLCQLVGVDSSVDVRKELEALVQGGEAEMVEACTAANPKTADLYLISKIWLTGWLKRKVGSINTDVSPTSAITCPHGALLPKAPTVPIPGRLWRALKELWTDAAQWQASHAPPPTPASPAGSKRTKRGAAAGGKSKVEATLDDDGLMLVSDSTDPAKAPENGHAGPSSGAEAGDGAKASDATESQAAPVCTDLHAFTSACPECEVARGEIEAARSQLRQGLEQEKHLLHTLALNVLPDMQPGATYNLIPRSWLAHWKAYVTQGPRKAGALTAAGAPYPVPAAEVSRPGPLLPALAQLLCPCHPATPHLRVAAPEVVAKRSKYEQASPSTDELVAILPSDWANLCTLYPPSEASEPGPPPPGAGSNEANGNGSVAAPPLTPEAIDQLQHGFTATLVLHPKASTSTPAVPTDVNNLQGEGTAVDQDSKMFDCVAPAPRTGSRGAKRVTTAPAWANGTSAPRRTRKPPPRMEGMVNGTDSDEGGAIEAVDYVAQVKPVQGMLPVLMTHPPVCEMYVQQVREDSKRQQLTYEGAEIMCEQVASEEDLVSAWPAVGAAASSAATAVVGERRSRRARRDRQPLTVNSWNTLADLKMHIFQALNVHPQNAQVYVRGVKVEGDELTLAALEIFPGEEVRVLSVGDADPSDLQSVFPGDTKGKVRRREVETGFRDTALQSGAGRRNAAAADVNDAAAKGDVGAAASDDVQQGEADVVVEDETEMDIAT